MKIALPVHSQAATLKQRFTFGVVAICSLSGCIQSRTPNMYIFPKNFKGEARIYYSISTAPPLPLKNGYRVIRFPQNGIVSTSTPVQSGRAKDIIYISTTKGLKQIEITDLGPSGQAQSISRDGVKSEYEIITVQ